MEGAAFAFFCSFTSYMLIMVVFTVFHLRRLKGPTAAVSRAVGWAVSLLARWCHCWRGRVAGEQRSGLLGRPVARVTPRSSERVPGQLLWLRIVHGNGPSLR